MKRYLLLLILIFAILPMKTSAAEIIFGTDFDFSSPTVDENYYIAGGNLKIDADFKHDLIVASGKSQIRGTVLGDALVIGGEVDLTNYVTGDLRVLSGTVNLSSTIEGDLILLGGVVNLKKDAVINGETVLIGGKINQNAPLKNNSSIIAGSVFLNEELSGTSEVSSQNIIFGKNANITGNLRYYAPMKAAETEGSRQTGTVVFNEISTIQETGFVKSIVMNVLSFWIILKFITTLIIAFILIQLFKVFTQRATNIAIHSFTKSFFFGLLSVIFVPVIFSILLISLVGLPFGFLLLLVYILILSISGAFSAIIVGNLVSKLLSKDHGHKDREIDNSHGEKAEHQVTFKKATVGLILLTTLQFINIVGEITILIFGLVSVGAIIRYMFRTIFNKAR